MRGTDPKRTGCGDGELAEKGPRRNAAFEGEGGGRTSGRDANLFRGESEGDLTFDESGLELSARKAGDNTQVP